jgi:hypothetical protein
MYIEFGGVMGTGWGAVFDPGAERMDPDGGFTWPA